jgi:hypothetical protein
MANGSDKVKKGFLKKWKYFLAGLLIVLILVVFFLPSFILKVWLNRVVENDPVFKDLRAEKARVTPLLTGFTIEGLRITTVGPLENVISIERVKADSLRPGTVLKLLFGFAGEDFLSVLSVDGSLELRDVKLSAADFSGISDFSLNTFYIKGLSFSGGTPGLANGSLGELKLTDFVLSFLDGRAYTFDSLSVFKLMDGIVGGLILSGLDLKSGSGAELRVGDFKADDLNLLTIYYTPGEPSISVLPSLADSLGALDLAALSLNYGDSEALFIKSLVLQTQGKSSENPGEKLILLSDLKATLPELFPLIESSPEGRVLLSSMGPDIMGDFMYVGGKDPKGVYRAKSLFSLKDSLEIGLNFIVSDFSPTRAGSLTQLFLLFLRANLGEGDLTLVNKGLGTRLYPALSKEIYSGKSAKDGLITQIHPIFRLLELYGVVNIDVLESEMALFLSEPRTLSLGWTPEPGFPGSTLKRIDNSLGGSLLTGGKVTTESIQKAVLKDINLKLIVNDRAPIYVVTGS